jgi:ABC-type transport system involved in multi-copper enzyme maturation permease subunit
MNRVATFFWNPIVAKEYRSRMRTWKSPVAMMVYILLIGGLGFLVFSILTSANSSGVTGGSNYGQILFSVLVGFQVVLLTFVTPALTAGAISSERERQTIDLLFVTRIPPFSIIWGKLLASMSFVFLLLILSVPIFSLVFLFGGIELDQVAYAFLVTLVTALTFGALGIAFSTWLRRSLVATVVSYVAAFVLIVGTLAFGLFFPTDIDPNAKKAPAPPAVTYLSPVIPLMWIAGDGQLLQSYGVRYSNSAYLNGGSGPGTICQTTVGGGTSCYSQGSGVPVGPAGGTGSAFVQIAQASGAIPSGLFEGWQYWQATIVMQLAICLVALLASAFLLPPVRRLPWRRRRTGAEPIPEVSS